MNKIRFDLCWCRCTLYIQLLKDAWYTVALILPVDFVPVASYCMVGVDVSEHQRVALYLQYFAETQ